MILTQNVQMRMETDIRNCQMSESPGSAGGGTLVIHIDWCINKGVEVGCGVLVHKTFFIV